MTNDMIKTMTMKLEALDKIEERMKTVENNVMEVKKSIEFAHAEIIDLKDETRKNKKWLNEAQARVDNLEETNRKLRDSVIDLKARSMRDNLLLFNIPEEENEDTTKMIHKLLEEKLEIQDATRSIKIDRSHRLGKQHPTINAVSRDLIVAKFNFFQDRENKEKREEIERNQNWDL
jgi:DNA repair ATPase RecN